MQVSNLVFGFCLINGGVFERGLPSHLSLNN